MANVSKFLKRGALTCLFGVSALVGSFYTKPLPERLSEQHSPMLLYRDGTVAHIVLAPDDRWRTKAKLEHIDPTYIEALLTIEDQRFYWHFGFDPFSIVRALVQNIVSGEIVSGASTITMQLVRLVEPRPRTYQSKLIEAWRAMQFEWLFSKDQILEMYLSFIPFGGNLEGVESASLKYFGQLPVSLEAHQIALLIAIPQNPTDRQPSLQNEQRLRDSRNHIADLLLQENALPVEDNQDIDHSIFSKPVPTSGFPFPRALPHLVDQVGKYFASHNRIQTTLDKKVQTTLMEVFGHRYESYAQMGIHNAAGIVTDRNSGEIRGLLGNFDYWSGVHGSTIASYSTPRSAGSTLKPFIFAQSLDLGLATPARIMEDIPQDFRGYQPRNYGASYHGRVSLSESLSESYNIPFVKLLSEIGLDPFLHFMQTLGIQHFTSRRSQLGLSVAVGLEVTPLELSQAYLVLANQGLATQMTLFDNELNDISGLNQRFLTQIQQPNLSVAASWLVGQSLRKRDRPDFPSRHEYTSQSHPLAWKTGTSFGFHDAWTVGWGDQYVSTVWFGNLHYGSSVHLIGSQAAGTVFFELMERLEEPFVSPAKPSDVTEITVCAHTGLLPNAACTETRVTETRRDRVPIHTCKEHRYIWVNDEGERSNPKCSSTDLQRQSVWVPSVEYQRWSKLPVTLPPIAQHCADSATLHSKLSIHNPKPEHRILLLPDGKNHNVQLIANHDDPNADLYWFIDQQFIGSHTTKEEKWWTPTPGTHTILVSDNTGQSDSIQVVVDTFQNVHTQ